MRRFLAILVVAALCGTVLSLGALMARPGVETRLSERPAPLSWALLAASPALAQEVMQFRPVPPESVAALDRRGAGASGASGVTTPAPRAPAAPAAPAAPPASAAPHAPSGRSGDIVRFGSNITIPEGQTVAGDVVAMGGDVTVHGHVEGEVVAMGGDVTLGPTGRVSGQVVTIGGQLHEAPGSHVGGQRVTAGGLPRGWSAAPLFGVLGMVDSGIKVAWTISKMLLLLLVVWGFTQLAPQRTRTALDEFKREPLKCVVFGLLAWVLLVPSVVALVLVFAILCITIIGIPLAIAVLLGYMVAVAALAVWGYVVGAALLGERLGRQLGRTIPTVTLMAVWGVVALTAVKVVGQLFGGLPMGGAAGGMLVVLAGVVSCVLMTIGAGALLRTQLRRDSLSQWWPGHRGAAPAAAPAPPAPASDPASPPPGPSPYGAPEAPPSSSPGL